LATTSISPAGEEFEYRLDPENARFGDRPRRGLDAQLACGSAETRPQVIGKRLYFRFEEPKEKLITPA
jgi:hypothetical protein